MSLLSVIQDAATSFGVDEPIKVIGSSNDTAQHMLRLLNDVGHDTRLRFNWPELQKRHVLELQSGQATYPVPGDLESFIAETSWDKSRNEGLCGAYTPEQWEYIQNGGVISSTHRGWRVSGHTDNQITIDPTPSTTGDLVVFGYNSNRWVRPPTWQATETLSVGDYRFYNGNYYKVTVAGTTGSTAPSHVEGTGADGTVTWQYFDGAYYKPLTDNDNFNIPEQCVIKDLRWRFALAKGQPYEALEREAERAWRITYDRLRPKKRLNFGQRGRKHYLNVEISY